MLKCTTSNPQQLKSAIKALNKIVDTIHLTADSEEIIVTAIDRGHIIFTYMTLKEYNFDIYECSKPIQISMDTQELDQILSRIGNDMVLTLSTSESELILEAEGDTRKTFKIKLIDDEYDSIKKPEIEYPVEVDIPSGVLKEAVGDIKIVSQKLSVRVDEENVIFEEVGDFGDATIEYPHGQVISEVVKSIYSLPEIESMLVAEKFGDKCLLSTGDDLPLTLTFKTVDDLACLSFILAPRIETDD